VTAILRHALWLICACWCAGAAADFPERPIRLVVGFTAGGPTDITGRVAAQILAGGLNTQALVENKPGASGAMPPPWSRKRRRTAIRCW